jgi:hypothetical protein
VRQVRQKPALYNSPISLPEAISGPLRVKHVKMDGTVPIIGMRQAFLSGRNPLFTTVTDRTVHELSEDGVGVWMTDSPEELEQIAHVMRTIRPSGSVLVGGLGLGVLATVLQNHPAVDNVAVVEKSQDVINLCRPRRVAIIHDDIFDYLRRTKTEYDTYYLDTWQATNEGEWWRTVMPLRRIIANRWGKKPVWCWAEDIMLGQCKVSAMHQGGLHWYYRCLPKSPSMRTVNDFFRNVGLPSWEKRYGAKVDHVVKDMYDAVALFKKKREELLAEEGRREDRGAETP